MNVNEQLGTTWENTNIYPNQDEVKNGYVNIPETYNAQPLQADENGWYHDEQADKLLANKDLNDVPDWYNESIVKDAHNDWLDYRNTMYGNSNEAQRKAGGQFYTPPVLALNMLRRFSDLPNPKDYQDADSYKKAMYDNTKTLLDPTAGAGSLLVPAIKAGLDPKLIYALEEDPNKIGILRRRLKALGVPDKNIFMGSALNENLLRKIKNKASNDPYLKGKKNKIAQEKLKNIPKVMIGDSKEDLLKQLDQYLNDPIYRRFH